MEEYSTVRGSNSTEANTPSKQSSTDCNAKLTCIIDGVMLIGETWDIVSIDGIAQVRKFAKIVDRKKTHYKGLEDYFVRWNRVYELDLLMINDCELSILFPATSHLNFIGQRIKYNVMAQTVHQMISSAILSTETNSSIELSMRSDGHIIVKEEDWVSLANVVRERILHPTFPEKENLPNYEEIFFLVKKTGQDRVFSSDDVDRYPQLRLQKSLQVVTHIAFDIVKKDDCLWWDATVLDTVSSAETKKFNVGLLPQNNNYQIKLTSNDFNITNLNLYTRIFHQLHRDENKIFIDPYVTRTLASVYGSCISNQKVPKLRMKEEIIFNGVLEKIIDAYANSLRDEYATRQECIWSKKTSKIDNTVITIQQIFAIAQSDAVDFTNHFGVGSNKLTPVNRFLYAEAASRWINIFKTTILKVVAGVNHVKSKTGPELLTSISAEYVLSVQDFVNAYVSEAFLSRLFRGKFGKYPDFLENFVFKEQVTDNALPDFPYTVFETSNTGLLSANNIRINTLFRNFNTILIGSYPDTFGEFVVNFNYWKTRQGQETGENLTEQTKIMISNLCDVIISHLLRAIGKESTENLEQLQTLWSHCTRKTATKICHTFDIYNIFAKPERGCSVSLAPLAPLLQNIRAVMKHRTRGGFQDYICQQIQRRILEERCPLKIPYNSNSTILVVPIIISSKNFKDILEVYFKVYESAHKTVIGKRNIHVKCFLKSLLKAMQAETEETLKKIKVGVIFELLRKLLDDPVESPALNRQLTSIQDALKNPEAEEFLCPATPRHDIEQVSPSPSHFYLSRSADTPVNDNESATDSDNLPLNEKYRRHAAARKKRQQPVTPRPQESSSTTASDDSHYAHDRVPLSEWLKKRPLLPQEFQPIQTSKTNNDNLSLMSVSPLNLTQTLNIGTSKSNTSTTAFDHLLSSSVKLQACQPPLISLGTVSPEPIQLQSTRSSNIEPCSQASPLMPASANPRINRACSSSSGLSFQSESRIFPFSVATSTSSNSTRAQIQEVGVNYQHAVSSSESSMLSSPALFSSSATIPSDTNAQLRLVKTRQKPISTISVSNTSPIMGLPMDPPVSHVQPSSSSGLSFQSGIRVLSNDVPTPKVYYSESPQSNHDSGEQGDNGLPSPTFSVIFGNAALNESSSSGLSFQQNPIHFSTPNMSSNGSSANQRHQFFNTDSIASDLSNLQISKRQVATSKGQKLSRNTGKSTAIRSSLSNGIARRRTNRIAGASYRKYAYEETRAIFDFIERNNLERFVGGNLIYERMFAQKVTTRTMQSMRNHVQKLLSDQQKLAEIVTSTQLLKLRAGIRMASETLHSNQPTPAHLNSCN